MRQKSSVSYHPSVPATSLSIIQKGHSNIRSKRSSAVQIEQKKSNEKIFGQTQPLQTLYNDFNKLNDDKLLQVDMLTTKGRRTSTHSFNKSISIATTPSIDQNSSIRPKVIVVGSSNPHLQHSKSFSRIQHKAQLQTERKSQSTIQKSDTLKDRHPKGKNDHGQEQIENDEQNQSQKGSTSIHSRSSSQASQQWSVYRPKPFSPPVKNVTKQSLFERQKISEGATCNDISANNTKSHSQSIQVSKKKQGNSSIMSKSIELRQGSNLNQGHQEIKPLQQQQKQPMDSQLSSQNTSIYIENFNESWSQTDNSSYVNTNVNSCIKNNVPKVSLSINLVKGSHQKKNNKTLKTQPTIFNVEIQSERGEESEDIQKPLRQHKLSTCNSDQDLNNTNHDSVPPYDTCIQVQKQKSQCEQDLALIQQVQIQDQDKQIAKKQVKMVDKSVMINTVATGFDDIARQCQILQQNLLLSNQMQIEKQCEICLNKPSTVDQSVGTFIETSDQSSQSLDQDQQECNMPLQIVPNRRNDVGISVKSQASSIKIQTDQETKQKVLMCEAITQTELLNEPFSLQEHITNLNGEEQEDYSAINEYGLQNIENLRQRLQQKKDAFQKSNQLSNNDKAYIISQYEQLLEKLVLKYNYLQNENSNLLLSQQNDGKIITGHLNRLQQKDEQIQILSEQIDTQESKIKQQQAEISAFQRIIKKQKDDLETERNCYSQKIESLKATIEENGVKDKLLTNENKICSETYDLMEQAYSKIKEKLVLIENEKQQLQSDFQKVGLMFQQQQQELITVKKQGEAYLNKSEQYRVQLECVQNLTEQWKLEKLSLIQQTQDLRNSVLQIKHCNDTQQTAINTLKSQLSKVEQENQILKKAFNSTQNLASSEISHKPYIAVLEQQHLNNEYYAANIITTPLKQLSIDIPENILDQTQRSSNPCYRSTEKSFSQQASFNDLSQSRNLGRVQLRSPASIDMQYKILSPIQAQNVPTTSRSIERRNLAYDSNQVSQAFQWPDSPLKTAISPPNLQKKLQGSTLNIINEVPRPVFNEQKSFDHINKQLPAGIKSTVNLQSSMQNAGQLVKIFQGQISEMLIQKEKMESELKSIGTHPKNKIQIQQKKQLDSQVEFVARNINNLKQKIKEIGA